MLISEMSSSRWKVKDERCGKIGESLGVVEIYSDRSRRTTSDIQPLNICITCIPSCRSFDVKRRDPASVISQPSKAPLHDW